MKRALLIALQTVLLLITAVVFGVVLPGLHRSPFHVVHVLSQQGFLRRQYEFDWLIAVVLGYLLLVLIGLVTRRIRTSWVGSTIALVLTILIGMLLKFGFKEVNLLYGGN